MAVDEAILEAAGRGASAPTLRLYAWKPACLSLGYAQPVADVDQAALAAFGWDLVRRQTGGRAILHVDELTYSIAGPQDDSHLAGSVLESYHKLAEALLEALRLLGVPAQMHTQVGLLNSLPVAGTNLEGAVCFETPSYYEITMHGKKLIGSAQARRREGVLQHGSLPLYGDLARITQALAFPAGHQRQAAALRLLERAATVEASLGYPISWEAAAQAFVDAFQSVLDLEFKQSELTQAERSHTGELLRDKYGHREWTERV